MEFIRFQSPAISPYTGEPYGIFVAVWHLVRDGHTSEQETRDYWEHRSWFEANLPVPPYHAEGNPDRAVTWFKEAALTAGMRERLEFYFRLARKYGLEISMARSANPGVVLYEDEFQIAVAGRGE
ncbi:hypothetical protein [Luteolibacter soli]|uniref:Uncharacterized protein n=1 Tax=Luteolibacter soli TaxID=3135280 RepID=A0ABU9B2B2_9BACT